MLIEDKEKIDIQAIEELEEYGEDTLSSSGIISNRVTVNKLNCRVCGKELAVKYGVCDKCYEVVNEDVR